MMLTILPLINLTIFNGNFKEKILIIFDKHTPIKQKYLPANEVPFMTKEMHREITKRSRLRNNSLRNKSQEDRLKYIK